MSLFARNIDTYTLPLPANLPPTYRGRIMKFTYHLVVGVCRSVPPAAPSAGASRGSTSQVMRVPVRIYNHVDVSGVQRPYDLLWPVLQPPTKAQTARVSETTSRSPVKWGALTRAASPQSPPDIESGADPAANLREYALRLLASLPDPSGDRVKLPTSLEAMSHDRELQGHSSHGGGELTGCREAVEILTRNMRKGSFHFGNHEYS